jgi:hypothetical protein
MPIDDHCDGSCSSMYTPGINIVSREEIERDLDDMLRVSRYEAVMKRFEDKLPKLYHAVSKFLPDY